MLSQPRSPAAPAAPVVSFSAVALIAAAIVCSPVDSAHGQVIGSFGGAFGPGLASMSFNSVVTPSIGNDDVVGASPNVISINQKAFSSTDYIDMLFHVDSIGVPTTEYLLTEGVFNGTPDFWIAYQVVLGYGVGAGFVQSTLGDGLGFDVPDYNSPLDFTPYTIMLPLNEDVINAVDAIVFPGEFHSWACTIDVPAGITEFTVRQQPRTAPVDTEAETWSKVKALYR